MSDEKAREGWAWPANSKKAHYFHGGRSLCGRWAWFGELGKNAYSIPISCATCQKKLAKRTKQ